MSDQRQDPSRRDAGHRDAEEPPIGSLESAPTTPTEDKTEPEAGTGSADKRSPESPADQA